MPWQAHRRSNEAPVRARPKSTGCPSTKGAEVGEAIRAEAYSKYVEHRIAEGDAADPPASMADCRVDGGFGAQPH